MSSVLPANPNCCTPCEDIVTTQVAGPTGATGAAGTNGTDGENAFTLTTANFTMPAVAGDVSVAVSDSDWATVGQVVFVQTAGYFTVQSKADSTHMTLRNLGYTGNVAPTTVVLSGKQVGPGGLKGADGVVVGASLNSISPTTTKGDLIVDNGANAPSASDVRKAAGANGTSLCADSTDATGVAWKAHLPNSGTDNALLRSDGSAGTPIPAQQGSMVLTDNGALQHTGGNAKGVDAVDLQVTRSNVANVASGLNAAIGGGEDNEASGSRSVIPGGWDNGATGTNSAIGGGRINVASATASVVAGGDANTASGTTAAVGGGISNTASGNISTISGGSGNAASGVQSVISGGISNTASALNTVVSGGFSNQATAELASVPGGSRAVANKYGQMARASGRFASDGDAQVSELLWRVTTTDATANVEAFLDGATGTQRATVPANCTWTFDILITVRRSNGDSICFRVVGGIKNDAGTTVLVAATTETVLADGTAGALTAANIDVDADNANDALRIRVTGIAAQTWRWVAHARIVECAH